MVDPTILALYLLATFLGGIVSGLAGFALGLVVSGIWLHIIPPLETAILMCCYGLFSQGYGIWKLRHALNWQKALPFILSGAVGVPIGAGLVAHLDAAILSSTVGVLLVLYSLYNLARPRLRPVEAGLAADLGVGFLNGLLGGLTGLAGIIVTVWCQLHDWPKDQQRTIFQPVLFATLAMSAVGLGVAGALNTETVTLFFLGLPVLLAGLWVGLKLYGRLDDTAFRRIVLILLLLSGISLLVPLVL
jgi:uncharacterized membrane protein YfcA